MSHDDGQAAATPSAPAPVAKKRPAPKPDTETPGVGLTKPQRKKLFALAKDAGLPSKEKLYELFPEGVTRTEATDAGTVRQFDPDVRGNGAEAMTPARKEALARRDDGNKLAVLEDIERRLAAVATVDEARQLNAQASALQAYCKASRVELSLQRTWGYRRQVKSTEHRAGELVRKMILARKASATGLKDFMQSLHKVVWRHGRVFGGS